MISASESRAKGRERHNSLDLKRNLCGEHSTRERAISSRQRVVVFSALLIPVENQCQEVSVELALWMSSLMRCSRLERPHESFDSRSKRRKSDEFLPDIQSSDTQSLSMTPSTSSTPPVLSEIDNKVSQTVDNQIGELKKMIAKMYALQKRTSTTARVRMLLKIIAHADSDTLFRRATRRRRRMFSYVSFVRVRSLSIVCLFRLSTRLI